MLWALAARIRDEGYAATVEDMRALIAAFGRGGPEPRAHARARIREVLGAQASRWPAAPFSVALSALERA